MWEIPGHPMPPVVDFVEYTLKIQVYFSFRIYLSIQLHFLGDCKLVLLVSYLNFYDDLSVVRFLQEFKIMSLGVHSASKKKWNN